MSSLSGTRPIRSHKEDREQALVEAAFNQIAERGFEGLLAREARDAYLAPELDSDDVAALIMATLTSLTLPSTASADRSDRAFRQLERWLGMAPPKRTRSPSSN